MKKVMFGIACLSLAATLSGCSLLNKINELIEGGEEVPISKTESKSRLISLGETSGVSLTYSYEDHDEEDVESGTIEFGMKENVVWFIVDDADGGAFVKENDSYIKYDFDGTAFVLNDEETYTQEDYNTLIDRGTEYLFFAHSLNGALKSAGEETYLGRDCYKYNFLFSDVLSTLKVNMDMELLVDKDLGITLKVLAEGETTDDSVMLNMSISSFLTGDAVHAPTLG